MTNDNLEYENKKAWVVSDNDIDDWLHIGKDMTYEIHFKYNFSLQIVKSAGTYSRGEVHWLCKNILWRIQKL